MSTILFVFVGLLCLTLGIRVFNAEERTTVFNKRSIVVKDVKKYNRTCGSLIIGFGVVAEITILFMFIAQGWVSTLLNFGLIAEAVILVLIYNKVERKLIKKSY